ncbi:hypothetical protein HNY73_000937 [Argiope bruennichi]|uniref:Uncharacterized protein n=1 Tax=Argiope bruennichi TaxID=94029 RepID=A0A8T0G2B3_ARGBR|nr:hypothetical protein HNY73_000937 [Argiope bruennichi]
MILMPSKRSSYASRQAVCTIANISLDKQLQSHYINGQHLYEAICIAIKKDHVPAHFRVKFQSSTVRNRDKRKRRNGTYWICTARCETTITAHAVGLQITPKSSTSEQSPGIVKYKKTTRMELRQK